MVPFMLKIVFFAFLLTSCAKHEYAGYSDQPNAHDLSGYVGEFYQTTNSPCLDGVLVNLGHNCATPIEFYTNKSLSIVQCHKTKKENSPWDDWNFIVLTDHNLPRPADVVEFCADLNAIIYIQERP